MTKKNKITYATFSTDNEALQMEYDAAIKTVMDQKFGIEVPMFINGEQVCSSEKSEDFSPVDKTLLLCRAQKGTADHARAAVAAAKTAFLSWRKTDWRDRVSIIKRIAGEISDNNLELSAALIMDVGKNRLEALGEVEETADLLRYYAESLEKNRGFVNEMGKLNPADPAEHNYSMLRPYGPWVVIAPSNFPMALSGAPVAAALLTGNTVVYKGSSDTLYTNWKLAELFSRAGLPHGVFNYVSGPGGTVGKELVENPDICGWTFTGSYDVGTRIVKKAVDGPYSRPAIVEMGGKNPAIVSDSADLEKAVSGVLRAAFGMDGQKCSACSRVYILDSVYASFKKRLVEKTEAIRIGDPASRDAYMGTVINETAYRNYRRYVETAERDGTVLTGGKVLTEGIFSKGYYVEPTIIEGLPEDHPLAVNELFLPILVLFPVKTLDEAMEKANGTTYGLTAGFYGENKEEVEWFFEHIQAGVTFSNREAGATTGAWPGIQAFGGWKGSGSSGKAIGSLYTLSLYAQEQSRTIIDF